MEKLSIVQYADLEHRQAVIDLWQDVFGYATAHNKPELVIDKKVAFGDGLFFVATVDGKVIGSIMAGYDGHRGWIYSLAVSPAHRRQQVGSKLVRFAEATLARMGCMKLNLQILEGNESVAEFYVALGFSVEQRVSMGRRIEQNIPTE